MIIIVLAMFGFCAAAEEGSSLFLLSSNGCGRATAYAATNKIVTAGSKTHASWLDSEGGRFWVRIRTYDHTTKLWSPTYTIGEAYDMQDVFHVPLGVVVLIYQLLRVA
mgnify:CR=1 FL=1